MSKTIAVGRRINKLPFLDNGSVKTPTKIEEL
jgi:hypothetical protein